MLGGEVAGNPLTIPFGDDEWAGRKVMPLISLTFSPLPPTAFADGFDLTPYPAVVTLINACLSGLF